MLGQAKLIPFPGLLHLFPLPSNWPPNAVKLQRQRLHNKLRIFISMLKAIQSIYKLINHMAVRMSFLLMIFIANPFEILAQQYSFTHYDIEDGLTQSQIREIAQDNSHHLLVATRLGIGRFDGKTFTSITKENGLTDNIVLSITTDKKGRIWGSGPNSLYYYYAGQVQKNVPRGHNSFAGTGNLITDAQDNIWGIKDRALFNISGGYIRQVSITGSAETITSIAKSANGTLFAAVQNKGIFCFENNKWTEALHTGVLKNKGFIKQIVIDDHHPEHFYILTNEEILSAKNDIIQSIPVIAQQVNAGSVNAISRDSEQGLWIGATQGAYYLNLDNNDLIHFNENNGFTNNPVNCLYRDIDDNTWFGTDGAGLYKFNGNAFVSFNQTQRFADPNIMQFSMDLNGNILMASSGSGLFVFDGKKIDKIKIPSENPLTRKVFSFCQDSHKNVWIGTLFGGLWEKTGEKITLAYPVNKNDTALSFNDIKMDGQNTVWFSTNAGCYYMNKNGALAKVLSANCGPLCVLGHDSVLVAANNRLVLLLNKKPDYGFKTYYLKNATILSVGHYKGCIFTGTIDYGLFVWNMHTGKFIKLNKQSGLRSNSIYSIGINNDNVLWLGTGRGINRFKIKKEGDFEPVADENLANLVSECNQNSLAFFNGQVWIGTTKGLYVLKDQSPGPITKPYTLIQDVQFFNAQAVSYTYKNGYKLPDKLQLPSGNSHITITFKGIDLKSPGSVVYSYMLSPLGNKFSPNSKNDFVDYPSLPPGLYTFYVKSSSLDGIPSNTAKFTFEINPSYYQTVLFKVAFVLLILVLIIILWKYSKTRDEKKRVLVERLRLEEQVKVRRQTAEDFHDDLGNKLTRINMLSDILSKRIRNNSAEEKQLIGQIKENADALFTGSKHILWALDPDNDQLPEVLNHLSEFGIDMFLNTTISFLPDVMIDKFKSITLPMGYGRNITLIFKELFNNTLKHSEAGKVSLSTKLNAEKDICIILEDDGKGFDREHVKKGYGLKNISSRAKKINGEIDIRSGENKGTRTTLILREYKHLF
jgi:ligand-binding sensor domain-containing protein/signal transduction histidine kinase